MIKKKKDDDGASFEWQNSQEWSLAKILEHEKEVLGFYLSRHPLDEYEETTKLLQLKSLKDIYEEKDQVDVIALGTINSVREISTKKGDLMAFAMIEDKYKSAECIFFPTIYNKCKDLLHKNGIFILQGQLSEQSNEKLVKIKVSKIKYLESENLLSLIDGITIKITQENMTAISKIKDIFIDGSSSFRCAFEEQDKKYIYHSKKKILLNEDIFNFLKNNGLNINQVSIKI